MTRDDLSIEARRVTTTAWGCRHTVSVRYFVVGDINKSDSYERGIASCAHTTRKQARDSIQRIVRMRNNAAQAGTL